MHFFAKTALQEKKHEMMEHLELANHYITTGGPLTDNLLKSIATMDRALKREQRSSAPVPTWEPRLKRNVEKLEELKEMKRVEEIERAKELDEV